MPPPPPVMDQDNNPRAELHQLQQRADFVVDESLESTRRMLALAEESQDAGAKTLQVLDQQGEQLDRIEEGMDQINADMKEAERNLKEMEKCCGLCVLPWKRTSDFKQDKSTWKGNNDGKVVNHQPQRVMDGRNGSMSAAAPQGGYIAKITNDDRENEMEDNLGQVSSMLGNLKNMAMDMGTEIETQNDQLDRINRKGESNQAQIKFANARTEKILKA